MNGLGIITADERLAAQANVKLALFGPSGVGKTTAARSLDPATTLFIDGEAGTKALGDWRGDVLDVRKLAAQLQVHPWELMRALACLLAGPDRSDYELSPTGRVPGPYSPEAFDGYKAKIGDPAAIFAKYRTIFVDSITVASRWSFGWSASQPESLSEKTGKKDTRGTYGLHGREMIRWLTQIQHAPLNVVVVGILDRKEDELHRVTFEPQMVGGTAARELPGIFDNVVTISRFDQVEGALVHEPGAGMQRGFVCAGNPWGLPGKDRSGSLAAIERPDLGLLLAKIAGGARIDATMSGAVAPPPADIPA